MNRYFFIHINIEYIKLIVNLTINNKVCYINKNKNGQILNLINNYQKLYLKKK